MNGYLNILKPPGMSSAAVVSAVKRLCGEKHVGHAGTLDPEAAGVLPIMIGSTTRLFDYLVDKEKRYVAEAAFGQETDTQDATGRVTAEGTAYPDREAVERAAAALTGDIRQRPGMYSALKKDGVPMYKLARAGEKAEIPERIVHIGRIAVGAEMPGHGFMLTVDCGRGTYIRSLCEDMGRLVGCPAHMRFLLRTRSGAFELDTAWTLEEAGAAAEAGQLDELLIAPDEPLGHLPAVDVPERLRRQAVNGVRLPLKPQAAYGQPVRVYLAGRFLGVAAWDEAANELVWRMMMPPERVET